jgi:hypothetical protein
MNMSGDGMGIVPFHISQVSYPDGIGIGMDILALSYLGIV